MFKHLATPLDNDAPKKSHIGNDILAWCSNRSGSKIYSIDMWCVSNRGSKLEMALSLNYYDMNDPKA